MEILHLATAVGVVIDPDHLGTDGIPGHGLDRFAGHWPIGLQPGRQAELHDLVVAQATCRAAKILAGWRI